jgi:hypothetical protein
MGHIRPEDIIMRTDDIMVKWKTTKGQGIVDITLHRKLKIENTNPYKNKKKQERTQVVKRHSLTCSSAEYHEILSAGCSATNNQT